MLIKLKKKAQTTAEYAILIALVVAAIAGMQVYIKRGINAQVKAGVDQMSTGMGLSGALQYEPTYSGSSGSTTQSVNETDTWAGDGAISSSGSTSVSGSRTTSVTN